MTLRNLALGATALVLAAYTVGCVSAPVVPPTGLIYTNIEAPINIGPSQMASKRGKADVITILGLFAVGDGSVKTAAQNGGISEVTHVDYEYKNVILGLYQRYTTVVYGN